MENNEKKDPRTEKSTPIGETSLPEDVPQAVEKKEEDLTASDENWDSRILCSDESCIGVIGSDGRCRECGQPAGPGFRPPTDGSQSPDDVRREVSEEVSEPEEVVDEDLVIADEEWNERILCSDESCIGVIGSDGRCRECGRPHEPDK